MCGTFVCLTILTPLIDCYTHTPLTPSLSGASFGSDTSDLLNPQEGFVYQDELGATHMELPVSQSPPVTHTMHDTLLYM